MWALRQASLRLRSQRNRIGVSLASVVKLMPTDCVEDEVGIHESRQITYGIFPSTKTFYQTGHASLKFAVSKRELSSQADASSTKEDDDLEDGFSELEKSNNEVELSDTEVDSTEEKPVARKYQPELLKEIVNAPGVSIWNIMKNWAEEGKELSREEIPLILSILRKRKLYRRALQLLEWLGSNEQHEFTEKEYVSRVDLIAKLDGLSKAEKYIDEGIPESFRGEVVYRTLLANCVSQNNLTKMEEVFNKMKDLGLPVTVFTCNQLLLMYKRVDRKKLADVLLLMEKENVRPNHCTYEILIDVKGRVNDIAGMDKIVETMKADGVEPNFRIKALLAKHYTSAGLKEKAKALLKEMEGEDGKQDRALCSPLLCLYADLGKAKEVDRIWNSCKSKPQMEECMAAVEAWGKLKKVKEAEAVFKTMSNKWKPSTKNYFVLLKVYEHNKMLEKAKDLIKRMVDHGCPLTSLMVDSLVKLHLRAGDVEKAEWVLQKVTREGDLQPMFSTYLAIMNHYANKGDVHNSEKIFYRMRQANYIGRLSQFTVLLKAYVIAKVPAYGMRERMKADNLFPNRPMAGQLVQVDAFRRTAVSDLFD